jgi:hypothetical protein
MAVFYPPARGLLVFLHGWWRRRRCPHTFWTPLDGCPRCGRD